METFNPSDLQPPKGNNNNRQRSGNRNNNAPKPSQNGGGRNRNQGGQTGRSSQGGAQKGQAQKPAGITSSLTTSRGQAVRAQRRIQADAQRIANQYLTAENSG